MASTEKASPWSQFPPVQHEAPLLTADNTLTILQMSDKAGALPLLIVDVRRNDYLGGAIKGSINLPAETFYWNREELYELCKRANIDKVAFYCGSSSGRGPRCAGWFADFLVDAHDDAIQSLTLAGGVKGWVKNGPEYVKYMKGFEPEYWTQFA